VNFFVYDSSRSSLSGSDFQIIGSTTQYIKYGESAEPVSAVANNKNYFFVRWANSWGNNDSQFENEYSSENYVVRKVTGVVTVYAIFNRK